MAAGDVKNGFQASLANDGTYDVQPGSGEEWVVHNLYAAGSFELYLKNSTNTILIDSMTGAGGFFGMCYHLTNTQYLQIKNKSGSAAHFAYDGIQTK